MFSYVFSIISMNQCSICKDNASTYVLVRPCKCDKIVHRKCFNRDICSNISVDNIFRCDTCKEKYVYTLTNNKCDILYALIKHLVITTFDLLLITAMIFLLIVPFVYIWLYVYPWLDANFNGSYFDDSVNVDFKISIALLYTDVMLFVIVHIMIIVWHITLYCRAPSQQHYWSKLRTYGEVNIGRRCDQIERSILGIISKITISCTRLSTCINCNDIYGHHTDYIAGVVSFIVLLLGGVLFFFVILPLAFILFLYTGLAIIFAVGALLILMYIIRYSVIHFVYMYKICYVDIYNIENATVCELSRLV